MLLAGIYLPAAGAEPLKPAAGVLGMTHDRSRSTRSH